MTSSSAEKTAEGEPIPTERQLSIGETSQVAVIPPAWNLTDTNIFNRLGSIEEQIDDVQYKLSIADNRITALFEPLQSIISNTRRISHDMTRDHDRILDYTRAFAREYDDMARERARDRESERSTRKRTANQTSQTRETQTNAVKRPKVEPSLRSTTRQLEDGEIASEKSTKPETSRNEQQTPTMPFEPARSCTFCGQKHWTSLCNEYPTIVQRLRRVYALKKCEKCLAPEDHSQEDCRKSHPCFYCRKANRVKEMNEHHTALCEFTFK